MANAIYNSYKGNMTAIDWADNGSTTIKVMLVTDIYVPDIDTHQFISDVSSEVSGTGYTAGGGDLINRTVTIDTTNDWAKYDGDDVVWLNSTITARGCVVYKDTGTPSASPLIAYIDFTTDKISTNGDFRVQWHVDGVFRLA